MAELADAHGSGPCGATCAGSNPVIRIKKTAVSVVETAVSYFNHLGVPDNS